MNELHLHIDGSLRRTTLEEWVPNLKNKEFGFKKGMSLQTCLECFSTTVAALNTEERISRAVREICEDQETRGVQSTELRFAPHIHGVNPWQAAQAAARGLKSDCSLILCGLYGDHPDILVSLVDIASKTAGIVGIDLAGAPLPSHEWKLADYSDAYHFAMQEKVGRTVHVSEGRGPHEIIDAITMLNVQRVGHACTLDHSERAMALVKERGIVVEACLTSNVHVGVFESVSEHPIKKWIQNGIRVSICADNTLMSHCDTMSEIEKAKRLCGLNDDDIQWIKESSELGLFGRE